MDTDTLCHSTEKTTMKHLTLSEQGSFCKLQGERILVFNKDQMVFEGTLNRLKTISIVKQGVTLTSNLLVACAMRGIQIFILDYSGKAVCSLQGGLHRTAKVRCQCRLKIDPFAR
ncbi:TPA: hypothetical protein F8A18_15080 [Legionella pneumophila]|nr:hypothetical protein [Legionella pneumophila]